MLNRYGFGAEALRPALDGSRLAAGAVALVGRWRMRSRTRRVLAELDDDRLRDIGLTREQARRESALPFWRP